jgi:small subunit ribosomal protein S8
MIGDPLSDMLTRMRNAVATGAKSVAMPSSTIKAEVARVLKAGGYISDYRVEGDAKKTLTIVLRYGEGLESAIRGLRRVSRCGLRRYCRVDELPKVLNGLGTAILSTSSGVMSDKEARTKHIGGEVLCIVW